ncbi:MAG: hypothetical protein ABIT71_19480 [Vicinamibacteraceae bacterium]
MTSLELSQLPGHRWMESRIPARAALTMFVAAGSEKDPLVAEMQSRLGASRWFSVQGGHRLLLLFDDGPYDASRCTIEAGAWDHEHCDACAERIPAMALCHVTVPGEPYVLLCAKCYARYVGA